MNKIQADLPEMISVRLPKSVIAKIDNLAEKRDSSRTSVIRSAITSYFRLADSILVPISPENRQRLFELSQQNKIPFDSFSEILMARAIELQNSTTINRNFGSVRVKVQKTLIKNRTGMKEVDMRISL
jgi:Arc/MetJ-type ribon-helix-helix transcriptional regulator